MINEATEVLRFNIKDEIIRVYSYNGELYMQIDISAINKIKWMDVNSKSVICIGSEKSGGSFKEVEKSFTIKVSEVSGI